VPVSDRSEGAIGDNSAGAAGGQPRAVASGAVPHVLIATDADWIYDEVDAALSGPEREVRRVRRGRDVLPAVAADTPELVVLDLQIGNMGGMATCMTLRLEEGAGRLPRVPIMMLLDRAADVFLAQRSEADGWLIKPLDAFRLRRAAAALTGGGRFVEGVPDEDPARAVG
jgi:DNA-binding response OmpR family regulator